MTQFGVHLAAPTGEAREFGELCGKIEGWGFDSIWLADGLTRNILEPLPVFAYASAFTSRVKLGTCVYVLPLRHPIATAKLSATVDKISGGRFILGVGVGWREDEFVATGISFERRGVVADECLEVIHQAWERGGIDFHGNYFQISGIRMELQPAQKPRPQIWVGGNGRAAARRAARFAECWIPTDYTVEEHRDGKTFLDNACKTFSRNPTDVKMASHLMMIIDKDKTRAEELAKSVAENLHEKLDDLKKWAIVGDPGEVARRIEEYNAAGVSYHVFNFATKVRDEERIELFARELLPSFV